MSRSPDSKNDVVDVSVQARNGSVVERRFTAGQLARMSEAEVTEPSEIRMTLACSLFEGRVALEGALAGSATMTCQRCMGPVSVAIEDRFRLLIVEDEAELSSELGGYEPILADPVRLDVRWLAEEQALLSLPLVPKHAEGCMAAQASAAEAEAEASEEDDEELSRQRPFADLRERMRDR